MSTIHAQIQEATMSYLKHLPVEALTNLGTVNTRELPPIEPTPHPSVPFRVDDELWSPVEFAYRFYENFPLTEQDVKHIEIRFEGEALVNKDTIEDHARKYAEEICRDSRPGYMEAR